MEPDAGRAAHRAHRPSRPAVSGHYADTVEADVYKALRLRIKLFENVVGRLQPILARLPTLISGRVLQGRARTNDDRQAVVNEIEIDAARASQSGFNIDAVTDAELTEPERPDLPVTMADLDRVIGSAALLSPGMEVARLGQQEFAFRQPGLKRQLRVSTNPAYYEQNADTIELWSPGNPTFPPAVEGSSDPTDTATLKGLLALGARFDRAELARSGRA